MRSFAKVAIGCLVFPLAFLGVLGGFGWWFVTKKHSFSERVQVPAGDLTGGTVPVEVSGEFELAPTTGTARTSVELALAPADFDEVLSGREYSLLFDRTDNPNVASMLGRLAFVPGSAVATVAGAELAFGAALDGELFVRASRAYDVDEEQPGSEAPLPLRVEVVVHAVSLGLGPDWRPRHGGLALTLALDEATRSAWYGRYGEGDTFADLVERLLNERATAGLVAIEATDTDLRTVLHGLLDRVDARIRSEGEPVGLKPLRFDRVAVDNCPSQDARGALRLGFAVEVGMDIASEELPTLPDLVVRPGPC